MVEAVARYEAALDRHDEPRSSDFAGTGDVTSALGEAVYGWVDGG